MPFGNLDPLLITVEKDLKDKYLHKRIVFRVKTNVANTILRDLSLI
jgi:hypothetical protein